MAIATSASPLAEVLRLGQSIWYDNIRRGLLASGAVDRALPAHLRGRVAIANAKIAYQRYKRLYASGRWRALAERGAQTQRLLWASTSTKDPAYRDVAYVEELIGADTVNTV